MQSLMSSWQMEAGLTAQTFLKFETRALLELISLAGYENFHQYEGMSNKSLL